MPIDPFLRRWRDEVGFAYQWLSEEANEVIRVWNGIPIILKGKTKDE